MITIGETKRLTNLVSHLNGLKVEVVEIDEDEEGVTITVRLLERPIKSAYRIGDLISVHAYELR